MRMFSAVIADVLDINPEYAKIIMGVSIVALVMIAILLAGFYLYNPYTWRRPHCNICVDITGKRNVDYSYVIDVLLWNGLQNPNMNVDLSNCIALPVHTIKIFQQKMDAWELWAKQDLVRRWAKKRRERQFLEAVNDRNIFHFTFARQQTKYKQVNYVRHPYIEPVVCQTLATSCQDLISRIERLQESDFCPPNKDGMQKQRSRMTQALRKQIMERDHYTCQICGKFMPDRVGLEIDHIVPVSKGGKTEPNNLQVLCSICNKRKSNK